MTIQLRIEGPNGEQLADSLSNLLSSEFQIQPQVIASPGLAAEGTKNIDRKLAVLAIVLALPGFVNDTADVAERLQLKQRIEKLITLIHSEQQPKTKVHIEVDGKPYLPSRNNLEQILNEINQSK